MIDPARAPIPEEFGNPWMKNLQEIALPEPVAWTPETVGWWVLAALAAFALLRLGWARYRRWRADAYRRAALQQLAAVEAGGPESLAGLPELLKRVALVAYPRGDVARLSGDAWLAFLDGTLGGNEFRSGPGRPLPDLAYDPGAAGRLSDGDSTALLALTRRWIRHHQRQGRR